jgi:hypothetical protein
MPRHRRPMIASWCSWPSSRPKFSGTSSRGGNRLALLYSPSSGWMFPLAGRTSASLSGGQVRRPPLNRRASLLFRCDRLLRPLALPVTATKRPCYRDKQEGPFGASNSLISRVKSRIMAATCPVSACFRADSSKISLLLRNNRDTGPKPNCLSSYRRTPEAKASLAGMNSPLFRALVGFRRVKGAG